MALPSASSTYGLSPCETHHLFRHRRTVDGFRIRSAKLSHSMEMESTHGHRTPQRLQDPGRRDPRRRNGAAGSARSGEIESRMARLNDCDIHYRVAGAGPTVVLLHGPTRRRRHRGERSLRCRGSRKYALRPHRPVPWRLKASEIQILHVATTLLRLAAVRFCGRYDIVVPDELALYRWLACSSNLSHPLEVQSSLLPSPRQRRDKRDPSHARFRHQIALKRRQDAGAVVRTA